MKGFIKIMRGLPGAGKTHYVEGMKLDGVSPLVCSADFFHMVGGVYRYQASNATLAHRKCFFDFMSGCQLGKPLIVVDNTNCDPVEIAPYVKLGEHFDYDVEILWVKTPIEVAIQRQRHGVPFATMIHMAQNLTKSLPGYWRVWEVKPENQIRPAPAA